MVTYKPTSVTKIKNFLREVSSRGGHTIYFEDNKDAKKLLDTGFKLLGTKASWHKPKYIDRFTGKKNSRNGIVSWSHLEYIVKYIDDDCTKGIEEINSTIHFRDGAFIPSSYLTSRQMNGLDVSRRIVYAMGLSSSHKYGIGSQAQENFATALNEIRKN